MFDFEQVIDKLENVLVFFFFFGDFNDFNNDVATKQLHVQS